MHSLCSRKVWLFELCGAGSQDRVLINQWKDELISGFRLSSQIMANMNKKVRSKYGAAPTPVACTAGMNDGIGALQHSLEKCSSEES